MKHPLHSYLLLLDPDRVMRHVESAYQAGVISVRPNTWQLCLGALRMWHRILFRSDTIGTSSGPPPRKTWRARLLGPRGFRLPALLAEGAVAPWDLTGLLSSPERITRHLLAAHHDKNQFVFDLQLLAAHRGRLDVLAREARRVTTNVHPRGEWLRDLTVYQGYHESLLEAAEAALAGDFRLTNAEENDPDLTLTGLLRWCAASPETPAATWLAFRAKEFTFAPTQSALELDEQAGDFDEQARPKTRTKTRTRTNA